VVSLSVCNGFLVARNNHRLFRALHFLRASHTADNVVGAMFRYRVAQRGLCPCVQRGEFLSVSKVKVSVFALEALAVSAAGAVAFQSSDSKTQLS
jgi:hypothetical protein